jgi:hypothetical protein
VGVDELIPFKGDLYAGTWVPDGSGGEVWRSEDDTTWTRVISGGLGHPGNCDVLQFFASDNLYAGTCSCTETHGAEIWRSASGDPLSWSRVVTNGFDAGPDNFCITAFELFDAHLYAGTFNYETGGQIWRTTDGRDWERAAEDGLGDYDNDAIGSFAVFDTRLYVGTRHNDAGGEIWRCSICDGTDWERVVDGGFGSTDNRGVMGLIAKDDSLYAVTENDHTGLEVWRTDDGSGWSRVSRGGFGDNTNFRPYWDNSVAIFDDRLYVGTHNWGNGGEVWVLLDQVFLPIMMRAP